MSTTIITGATSGIGLETAKGLAKEKHNLILVSRNLSKLETTKKLLDSENNIACDIYEYDLSLIKDKSYLYMSQSILFSLSRSLFVDSSLLRLRETKISLCFSLANPFAVSKPIPDVAPVMIVVGIDYLRLIMNDKISFILFFLLGISFSLRAFASAS